MEIQKSRLVKLGKTWIVGSRQLRQHLALLVSLWQLELLVALLSRVLIASYLGCVKRLTWAAASSYSYDVRPFLCLCAISRAMDSLDFNCFFASFLGGVKTLTT